MSVLGPPFPARRRVDLFFITRVIALLVLLCIRVPLATLAPARSFLDVLLLHSIGHRVHINEGLKGQRAKERQSTINKVSQSESRRYLAKQNHTCFGWHEWSNGITLLDPRGLSLLLVIPHDHFSTVSSLTSSGWIRVESSSPEYIHIGWSRA